MEAKDKGSVEKVIPIIPVSCSSGSVIGFGFCDGGQKGYRERSRGGLLVVLVREIIEEGGNQVKPGLSHLPVHCLEDAATASSPGNHCPGAPSGCERSPPRRSQIFNNKCHGGGRSSVRQRLSIRLFRYSASGELHSIISVIIRLCLVNLLHPVIEFRVVSQNPGRVLPRQ